VFRADGTLVEAGEDGMLTDAGPLVNLFLSASVLAALGQGRGHLRDRRERARRRRRRRQDAARQWKKVTIHSNRASKVHEVHGAAYGYAMANVRVVTKPSGEAYKLDASCSRCRSDAGDVIRDRRELRRAV